MKRVYLLIGVLVLLFSVGKFVLFPSPTSASLGISPELAVPTRTGGNLPTSDYSSTLTSASLPGKGGSSEDGPDTEASLTAPQTLPGLVVPAERVAIRANLPGTIGRLPVGEGTSVVAGQAVAQIDDREILAELERQTARIASAESLAKEAEALVDLAEYNHRLTQRLSQKQIAAKAALVESGLRAKAEAAKLAALQGNVAVAQHEKAVLKQRLGKYRAIAPFSGCVTEILRYRDQYVDQGEVILWIESHQKQLKLHLSADLIEECGGALDRLQVSMLVQEDQWVDLEVDTLKPNYNPDGSRTVLFNIGPKSKLLTGQIVKTKVSLRGEKS